MLKKLKLICGIGGSGSKKYKWGCGGTWSQVGGFVLVRLAVGFSRRVDFFTFNLPYTEVLLLLHFQSDLQR
jgi:hypothetical protein